MDLLNKFEYKVSCSLNSEQAVDQLCCGVVCSDL